MNCNNSRHVVVVVVVVVGDVDFAANNACRKFFLRCGCTALQHADSILQVQ